MDGAITRQTTEAAQAVVAMVNGCRWDRIEELFAEDVILHAPLEASPRRGRKAVRNLYESQACAIADLEVTVVEMVVEGERALVRSLLAGTHRGELGGFKASGRQFEEVDDAGWYRVAEGRIVESWIMPTTLSILEKLDLVPSGPPPKLLGWLLQLRARLGGGSDAGQQQVPQVPDVQLVAGEHGSGQKYLVRKGQLQFFGGRNWDLYPEVFAPEYEIISKVDHVTGRQEVLKLYEKVTQAFPDLYFTLEDLVAQGDLVGVLATARGTHLGPLEGFPGTGKRYEAPELFVFVIRDGLVRRQWHFVNFEAMMRQIGLVPDGPPPLPLRLLLRAWSPAR